MEKYFRQFGKNEQNESSSDKQQNFCYSEKLVEK